MFGGVGGVGVIGFGFGFTNPVGTGGVCLCLGCAVMFGAVAGWLGPASGRVGWCYVCVSYESGFFV